MEETKVAKNTEEAGAGDGADRTRGGTPPLTAIAVWLSMLAFGTIWLWLFLRTLAISLD